jgi:hypothetical protein
MNIAGYQAILDSAKHPSVFVDNDHIIRFMNRAAKIRNYAWKIRVRLNRISFRESLLKFPTPSVSRPPGSAGFIAKVLCGGLYAALGNKKTIVRSKHDSKKIL